MLKNYIIVLNWTYVYWHDLQHTYTVITRKRALQYSLQYDRLH